jgi:thioesterase domain-containing protein
LRGRSVIPALYNVLANTFGLFREKLPLDAGRWILRALGRRTRKWLQAAFGLPPDFDAASEPSRLLQDQAPAPGEAHLPALRSYRAGPSSVPITLFRARDVALLSLPLDRTLGWGATNAGDVRVYKIPGDHISITTEPLVRQTAKALCDALNIAQGIARVSGRAVDSYRIGQSVRT